MSSRGRTSLDRIGFFDELAARFSLKRSLGGATVIVPEHPADLEEIALRYVDPSDGRWIEGGSAYDEFGHDADLTRDALLAVWSSSAPLAWDDRIEIIEDAGRRRVYVALPPNPDYGERPWLALAALPQELSAPPQDAFLGSLLEDRGASYGVEIWGTLPTEITNYVPRLFSRAGVFSACHGLLDWESRNGNDQWPELLEYLRTRTLERELVSAGDGRSRLLRRAIETFRINPQSAHDKAEAQRLANHLKDPANRALALEAYLGLVYSERVNTRHGER